MLQNRCDVHTHTLYSRHAYSTVREDVLAAREAGLELLGVTDHFSDMLFPNTDLAHASLRDYQHFINMRVLPRTWEGVRLLHGAEADIRGLDGSLFGQGIEVAEDITGRPAHRVATLYDRVTASCDYVIASVHYKSFAVGATLAQTTEMYLGALAQPKVLVLGHTGRAGIPFDVREVVGRPRVGASSSRSTSTASRSRARAAARGRAAAPLRRPAPRPAARLPSTRTRTSAAPLAACRAPLPCSTRSAFRRNLSPRARPRRFSPPWQQPGLPCRESRRGPRDTRRGREAPPRIRVH